MFNRLFLTLDRKIRIEMIQKSAELPLILKRLYKMPTFEEALNLGSLKNDDNFGASTLRQIVSEDNLEKVKRVGAEKFADSAGYDETCLWYEGAATIFAPNLLLQKQIMNSRRVGYEQNILDISRKIINDRVTKVIVYGAGEAGRRFLSIFKLFDIEVVCFIDKSKYLQRTFIDGIKVCSLENAIIEFPELPFVIGSFAHTHEILDIIKKAMRGDVVTVYF